MGRDFVGADVAWLYQCDSVSDPWALRPVGGGGVACALAPEDAPTPWTIAPMRARTLAPGGALLQEALAPFGVVCRTRRPSTRELSHPCALAPPVGARSHRLSLLSHPWARRYL